MGFWRPRVSASEPLSERERNRVERSKRKEEGSDVCVSRVWQAMDISLNAPPTHFGSRLGGLLTLWPASSALHKMKSFAGWGLAQGLRAGPEPLPCLAGTHWSRLRQVISAVITRN